MDYSKSCSKSSVLIRQNLDSHLGQIELVEKCITCRALHPQNELRNKRRVSFEFQIHLGEFTLRSKMNVRI